MNKNELRSQMNDLIEQKAPAAQIDLWPALQARLPMNQPEPMRGTIVNTHSPSPFRRWKPAYLLLSVILISALFFAFPQGRAMGQAVLRFFQRGESNLMPGVTVTPVQWVEQTPGVAAATITPQPPQPTPPGPAFEAVCGSYQAAHCSIELIRSMARFPVFALSSLPEGMRFIGATGGPDQLHLYYDTPQQTGFLILLQKPFTGAESLLAMEVGADADIQGVQIGSVQAEYVKGSYDGSSNTPVWNSELDLQQMRWVDQGLVFTLYMSGTQPRMTRDELVALAATLTDGPVDDTGQPAIVANDAPTPEPTFDPRTLYPLTLAQAGEQAGFTPLSPAYLPEIWTFLGASYDEETKIVTIGYNYNDPRFPGAANALIIREQLAPDGADCDLCSFVQGNGKQVDQYPLGKLVSQDATIETVNIQEITGRYLEGIGWTSWTDATGWQWDSDHYVKRLRFRTTGLAVDVTAYTYELTKADMVTIAESMK
jgi:hypothetical protein